MHGNFRIGMRIAVVCLFCVVVLLLVNQWRLDHEWATAVELQKSTAPNGETRMVKTVDGVEYAFRWCPPGKFKMGRPFSKLESPQHEVTLTNGFWMLETEVTQAMWKSVMGEKLDDHKGSKFPVEQVNWYTCLTFCRKLSSKIGMPILFPTEAQWEYACRAGTTGPYAGRPHAMGWFKSNSGGTSHPVGQKKPNAWGLYDMHGNVSEWCFDRFGCCYPRGSVTDPVISEEPYTSSHVFRGGSWNDEAKYGTSTIRDSISPDSLSDSGFRVVSLIDAEVARIAKEEKRLQEEKEREWQKRVAQAAQKQKETAPNGETRLVKTVDGVEYAFRWCPPGKFRMRRNESSVMESDKDEYENQPPQVTLPKGFWMLETEVTQAMWKSVMGENPSHFKGDDLPVEQVSWDDCQEFCHRLSDKIGMTISIPTEAHWEYACQAGVPHYRPLIEESRFNQWAYAYHAGIQSPHPETGDLEVMGWYRENANKVTHPVGQKQANAWGLYDMYGNVGEWCNDYYGDYYPSGTAADPIGPPLGSEHIVRGNSLRRSINACYLYYRESPDHQDYGLGFRVIIMDGP